MAEPLRKPSRNFENLTTNAQESYWQSNEAYETVVEEKEPIRVPDYQEAPATDRSFLSFGEKLMLGIVCIVALAMICLNLVIQYQTTPFINATEEIQIVTSDIESQTKILINEIAERHDYDIIKQIAEENGMQLEKSRVRNVGE